MMAKLPTRSPTHDDVPLARLAAMGLELEDIADGDAVALPALVELAEDRGRARDRAARDTAGAGHRPGLRRHLPALGRARRARSPGRAPGRAARRARRRVRRAALRDRPGQLPGPRRSGAGLRDPR